MPRRCVAVNAGELNTLGGNPMADSSDHQYQDFDEAERRFIACLWDEGFGPPLLQVSRNDVHALQETRSSSVSWSRAHVVPIWRI